ncbi:hypothetical protein [Vibrio marisflavi]|uniref:Uncharacterized protein n=1 Tax=Vibrio marisflavi CECT 7928 TaxID=634439 RepID=A0ABM9A9P7_9VIBR|nr:hypothetical protein [Vibrio marisflavi]CAH0542797.1 hypothetical protein VMF7928_04210 [Vibrio marisflavi CECT 7928]
MANSKVSIFYLFTSWLLTGFIVSTLAIFHPKNIVHFLLKLGISLTFVTRRELCVVFLISLSVFILLLILMTWKK